MTHLLLFLILGSPPKPTSSQWAKLMNAQQQIVNKLTQENEKLKTILYGPSGAKVYPQFYDHQPYCPVNGFTLEWEVDGTKKEFVPFCLKLK